MDHPEFICDETGKDTARNLEPFATLSQVSSYTGGGTTLHLRGTQVTGLLERGKRYRITVEEVK